MNTTENTRLSDVQFNEFALKLYDVQRKEVQVYREMCERQGVGQVHEYCDIPAMPTDAFKYARISRGEESDTVFRTSGTTLTGLRGEHYFPSTDLYRVAAVQTFGTYVLPGSEKLSFLMLVPSAKDAPDSSLSFMMQALSDKFSYPNKGRFFATSKDGELTFDFDAFEEALTESEKSGLPVFVMGTAFAWVNFFEHTTKSWKLPAGSRLLETGGFKGRSREVSKEELYTTFEGRLGLPGSHLVAEYSMTELSSQAYTHNLLANSDWRSAWFAVPSWVRVQPVDPETMTVINTQKKGTSRGLLRWYDLANVWSVQAIQTSDIATVTPEGLFKLEGRAEGAELRGCSLMTEEILKLV